MFARLDTNKDGKITQAEADAAQAARAQAKGKPATAHTSSGLFARLDSNKDGVVTKAEFDTAAAQMLRSVGVESVRLLTNNPDKAAQLAGLGIAVDEIVRTGVHMTAANARYLRAKRDRTGHLIDFPAA